MEMSPREGFVAVARVLGSWGARGAVKLESLTDFPERFDAGARLWLQGELHSVEASHRHRGAVIVKLSGIDRREEAAALRESLLELPEGDLHQLSDDQYFQHDLFGLAVRRPDGQEIGSVTALLPTAANDVLVVDGPAGEYLLPLIEDVVRIVDLESRQIVVELLAGLEPRPKAVKRLNRASRKRPRWAAGPPKPGDDGLP